MSNPKAAFSLLGKIYEAYHKDAGKMLIHTGVISWMLSSAAQIAGIIMNDKIPKEQKMFLIPQEFADACFNILSFYVVTRSCTAMVDKMIISGKWLPSNVKNYLIKNGFKDRIGKFEFNILKEAKLTGRPKRSFELFQNGMGVIASTLGSILSCNIITPLSRNIYASHRQQENIAKMNNPNPSLQNPQNNRDRTRAVIHKTYMQAFMNRGNLKV